MKLKSPAKLKEALIREHVAVSDGTTRLRNLLNNEDLTDQIPLKHLDLLWVQYHGMRIYEHALAMRIRFLDEQEGSEE